MKKRARKIATISVVTLSSSFAISRKLGCGQVASVRTASLARGGRGSGFRSAKALFRGWLIEAGFEFAQESNHLPLSPLALRNVKYAGCMVSILSRVDQ